MLGWHESQGWICTIRANPSRSLGQGQGRAGAWSAGQPLRTRKGPHKAALSIDAGNEELLADAATGAPFLEDRGALAMPLDAARVGDRREQQAIGRRSSDCGEL